MWKMGNLTQAWITLLSLFLPQSQLQQGPNPYGILDGVLGSPLPQPGYFINTACFTANERSGVCQSLVECARYNDEIEYLRNSHCLMGPRKRGVCCPIDYEEHEEDPMVYVGQAVSEQNMPIIFPESPRITTKELNEACEVGIIGMKIRKKLERNLVRRYIVAASGSSAFWHSRLFQTSPYIYSLSSDATLVLLSSASLVKTFTLKASLVYDTLTRHDVAPTILRDTCPPTPPCGDPRDQCYRTYDGACNNLLRRGWGAVGAALGRLIRPVYADGLSAPRFSISGRPLPSPRAISTTVHPQEDSGNQDNNHTLLLMQWGQFLDHDLTHTPITKGASFADISCCQPDGTFRATPDLHPECLPILVPQNDTFYQAGGITCLDFVRSMAAVRPGCTFGPREQMNQVTSYVDGSGIYGSNEEEANSLRAFSGGKLRLSNYAGNKLLPPNPQECQVGEDRFCFKAGDSRVNEQPQLAAMHTIWARHHNQVARGMGRLNPSWDDETLYQETRRVVAAQIQHITYNEFLPVIIGRRFMATLDLLPLRDGFSGGYRDDLDATILNSFATAAFRFGHSLVPGEFKTYHRSGDLKSTLNIEDSQFDPSSLYESGGGVEELLRGVLRQRSNPADRFFVNKLTTQLFAFTSPFGLDLVALNIQRGRDHGLAPYMEWRRLCQGEGEQAPLADWEDLDDSMDEETISSLKAVYEDVSDIDLFVGGMCEKPVEGGLVGSTFRCIIAKQFIRLKFGDRFYYESTPSGPNGSGPEMAFSPEQLDQIRKTSLARVLCGSSKGLGPVQPLAFFAASEMNPRSPCGRGASSIPSFSLLPWKDVSPFSMMNMTAKAVMD